MISKILSTDYFKYNPPVLVDVGASGEINPKWKAIAPHSICVCFDADDREFNINEVENSGYKKLIKINRVVTDTEDVDIDFYLTKSPYCSSALQPDTDRLKPWVFSNYFDVERIQKMKSTTIAKVLSGAGISYIDWLKLDTQGTDLRLYTSLPAGIRQNILATELEPGIIDAYKGEDKLQHVLESLHREGYWLSQMEVKGTQRLDKKYPAEFGDGNLKRAVPVSPGWAELTYLREAGNTDVRGLFLLYIFALLQNQLGYALEICDALSKRSGDLLVAEARNHVFNMINAHDLKNITLKQRVRNFLLRKFKA